MVELLKKLGEGLKTLILKIIQFFKDIRDWFMKWKSLNPEDKKKLIGDIKTRLANGDYEVIRFVFDQETENIVDGNRLIAPEVDEELENVHKGKELVLYE